MRYLFEKLKQRRWYYLYAYVWYILHYRHSLTNNNKNYNHCLQKCTKDSATCATPQMFSIWFLRALAERSVICREFRCYYSNVSNAHLCIRFGYFWYVKTSVWLNTLYRFIKLRIRIIARDRWPFVDWI